MTKNIFISIVDDDKSVRQALAGLIKSHGYHSDAFDSATSFLNSDRRQGTDCLIADVQMSGMTGFELYDRLVLSGEPIPTILITGHPSELARSHALKLGVHCYLAKPFKEDELLDCIRTAVGSSKNDRRTT